MEKHFKDLSGNVYVGRDAWAKELLNWAHLDIELGDHKAAQKCMTEATHVLLNLPSKFEMTPKEVEMYYADKIKNAINHDTLH